MALAIHPKLADHVSRWRAALRATDTGPLVIAKDVVQVADDWERYQKDTGGVDCTTWLRKELGPGKSLYFFAKRNRAVDLLGEDVRRWMHHEVAVWLVAKVANEAERKTAKAALHFATKRQRSNPLTLGQAKRIVAAALKWESPEPEPVPETEPCARCATLEALLRANGVEIPE